MKQQYLNAEFVGAVIVAHCRVRQVVLQLATGELPEPVAVSMQECGVPVLLRLLVDSGKLERSLMDSILWFNGFRNKVAHGADLASFDGRMDSLQSIVPPAVRPWSARLRSEAAPEKVMRAFMCWLVAAVEELRPPGDEDGTRD